MHLLRRLPGSHAKEETYYDLAQSPGNIVVLSSADTDLSLMAQVAETLPGDFPSIRVANFLYLKHPAAVDHYIEKTLQYAQVVVVILLGGPNYWPYGLEQLKRLCATQAIRLIVLPGDDQPDTATFAYSNVPLAHAEQVWRYCRESGPYNISQLFYFLAHTYLGRPYTWTYPKIIPKVSLYVPHQPNLSFQEVTALWQPSQAVVMLLFYRNHLLAGNTQVFDALISALNEHHLNVLAVAINSLKDGLTQQTLWDLCQQAKVALFINTTGFAICSLQSGQRQMNGESEQHWWSLPVIQTILSSGNQQDWLANNHGLSPTDLAMNVVLPEVDGRIIARCIGFKGLIHRSERTQWDIIGHEVEPERVRFTAQLSENWVKLGTLANQQKQLAIILANYPTKNGRVGNGVGLDTPASLIHLLNSLKTAGYQTGEIPANGDTLMTQLLAGVSNDISAMDALPCYQSLALTDYHTYFAKLPGESQQAVIARWGTPEADAMVRAQRIMIPGIILGQVFIGIQPARGYHLDAVACYHDPDLVPTHAYLAFYFWLRHVFNSHAIIHLGKHGNLEWLPGKSVTLSRFCWPDIALGPLPHFYPFIVNDPGEGTQAKRRAHAVIIDHLVPPLARAEIYGELLELENAVDEYYQALSLDSKRALYLQKQIVAKIHTCRLEQELPKPDTAPQNTDQEQLITRLDTYLCELKEAQIRQGLHIFGQSPQGELLRDFICALIRLPFEYQGHSRGTVRHSFLKTLCLDLGLDLDFDPLNAPWAENWPGPKPEVLNAILAKPWRSYADTRERLELLAADFISALLRDDMPNINHWPHSHELLLAVKKYLIPAIAACGPDETRNLLDGLAGAFVPPGPSGAPSRGRLDVLPTGRNFYSVDARALPTPAAWHLGFKSAHEVIQRYLQEHGEYPQCLGLSVWGTATMRTGGDDIAQALAFIGVKPVWNIASNRVVDIEIIPVSLLDRPRIDVTLRISGFFRDAFANLIELFSQAIYAVAALDESDELNPIKKRVTQEKRDLMHQGLHETVATRQAHWRIFGSKPGAYGTGLQGLIDQRLWQNPADLAATYITWGGYAYESHENHAVAHTTWRQRLSDLDIVLQNQDNREHDILDSDDYYQFQGGMTVAATVLQGQAPSVYFGDHSLPEHPRIRTLAEEISRVIRSRVVNPKWLKHIKNHGYKGAFEMAATVDYLFAYDATTNCVQDYQYALVFDSYLNDPDQYQFLKQHNPHALLEISERFLEAMQRGLWQNPGPYQEQVENIILSVSNDLEV